ncbi:MAG TPA: FAD-binding oxidoreductase [Acidobacteriota bacterium]|nr:FAD-binding oxidoreductase [Acidobacteriota bacterium]
MAERKATEYQELDNTVWDHKWGFADTQFIVHNDRTVELTGKRYLLSGYRMHAFLPYVEEVLGITLDLDDVKEELTHKPVEPPRRNDAFCEDVERLFPATQFSFDDRDRLLHSHGQTTTDEVYRVLYERLQRYADMVVYPESEDDTVKLVELADLHGVCLVPFGGGTSVSSALTLPREEERMIVVVDMRRMNRILWIDKENFRACVEAGIRGMDLEDQLNREGFTCGHEPDSIELSTLGGWIATKASGMKKNRYGNIEHLVEQLTLVTPGGVVGNLHPFPRTSQGIEPELLAFGSEGNLGIITKAVIKLFPKPEVTKYGSLVFPTFELGVQFLEELAHTDFIPASIRLVDNIQFKFALALKGLSSGFQEAKEALEKLIVTKLLGFDPDRMVAATIVMEGSRQEVNYQQKHLFALAKKYHGVSGGADAGRRGYMLTYAIAYIRDFVARYHIIGETFETSAPWSKILPVCKAVEDRATEEHKKYRLPGKFYVSYRITQVYQTGACIYFMMGLYMKGVENPAETFGRMERSLRRAILESGGSISHHHGVGKLRAPFMTEVLTPGGIDLVRQLKGTADPKNTFGIGNNIFCKEFPA